MQKDTVTGGAQVGLGSYLAYKGLEHGLPRAFGIRTELHITTNKNAKLIKQSGNYLDPKFGGKTGWSAAVQSDRFMRNSKNFIHITGLHKNNKIIPEQIQKLPFTREIVRRGQVLLYNTLANQKNPNDFFECSNMERAIKIAKSIFWKKNSTVFYIPGIDSYFNKNFINDCDDNALKYSKKLKCYNNRFSAMIDGIKNFGFKGISENKARAGSGLALTLITGCLGYKLIKKGIKKITKNNNENAEKL